MNDLDFSQAQLDCVEAFPLLPLWQESVPEPPDPELSGLAEAFFDTLEEALVLCVDVITIGEYRAAADRFQSLVEIYARIEDRVSEIYTDTDT